MQAKVFVAGVGLLIIILLAACAATETELSPEQADSSETERPLTEQEQVMKENRELLKKKLAEIDIREDGREWQLDALMEALSYFRDAKVGHPIGRIKDISIVVDEEKTVELNSSYKVYSLTFSDEWGTEYTGSLDELGGVGFFESVQYDPDTGDPIIGLGWPPIS